MQLACNADLPHVDICGMAELRTCDSARGVALARVDRQVLLELQQNLRHHIGVVAVFALQKHAEDTGLAPVLKQPPKHPSKPSLSVPRLIAQGASS